VPGLLPPREASLKEIRFPLDNDWIYHRLMQLVKKEEICAPNETAQCSTGDAVAIFGKADLQFTRAAIRDLEHAGVRARWNSR